MMILRQASFGVKARLYKQEPDEQSVFVWFSLKNKNVYLAKPKSL